MNNSQSKSNRVHMDKVHNEEDRGVYGAFTKKASMNTLIIWNVSKAVEKNPCIDLKSAIKAAQERLDSRVSDVSAMIPECPEERHLACALLAWHQLGHNDADSLCQFIESNRIKESESIDKASNLNACENWNNSKMGNSTSFDAYSLTGPVLKLPADTKIVMRMESVSNSKRPAAKEPPKDNKNLKDKIDAACCMESGCIQRLAEMDALTLELRTRAGRLARREAERVELLERAEAAWKDLESGYQRRITLAKEKESDLTKQTEKLIEERNNHKNEGMSLAQQLKEKGQAIEKDRANLTKIEKDVCDSACKRLRLGEEAARVDATLAELQCKAAQLDRDLQFKEEQARRKMLSMESELESARTLTHEAERALRGELGALREQIAQVSDQLLKEDAINTRIKQELENLREEKDGMVEDLEGCKVTCDNKMQGKLDELKKKRDQLTELRERVIECKCKLPVDAAVEARRTPSLAAVCDCKPEDKLVESCSCTSLRTSLLSNLLADLFGGLQAELGGSGLQMPCHLLKCLEDKHNWDRSSVIKTNLRNYFSKLLIGELEIAIATSIEKYHAKWVGASCADVARLIPEPGDPIEDEGWEERALERKAQKMATKLAEQLFQERADELTQRAKDLISSGPPPCKCGPQPAVFSCLVKSPTVNTNGTANTGNGNTTPYWRRTLQNVTQLRLQIEDLKKDSLKKEDLKVMEEKITQIVTGPEKDNIFTTTKNAEKYERKGTQSNFDKLQTIKRRPFPKPNFVKKEIKPLPSQSSRMDKPYSRPQKKTFNKQSFAINVCLCSSQKEPTKLAAQRKIFQKEKTNDTIESWKPKPSEDRLSQLPSIKQTKPITQHLSQDLSSLENSKIVSNNSCPSNCVCFHKIPSNTSINKLLETLERWKNDLTSSFDGQQKNEFEKKGSVKFEGDKNTRNTIKTQSIENPATLELDKVKTSVGDVEQPNEQSKDLCTKTGSKSLEFGRDLHLATESEYMGQIIFDKSNENLCKCNESNETLIDSYKQDVKQNIDQNSEYPVKCINVNECGCKNSHKVSSQISNDQCLKTQQSIFKQTSESTDLNNHKQENELDEIKNDALSNFINSERNQITKNFELLPCNCGYFVKFLGVTLTKANCEKKKYGESINDREKGFSKDEGELQNIKSFRRWDSQSATIDQSNDNKNISYHEKNTCTEMPTCQCSINLDEFKQYIDSTFSKQRGDYNSNKDKALDIQSFKDYSFINEEYCICCGSSNTGEVEDLEVNTFHLLEDHLKEKIENFKTSYCKSSCIPVEEEQKLFETILKRVRKIIERSTMEIQCKCSGEEGIQESFNRAYCLLKEYLKTKIKRVQCSCVPSQGSENSVLPGVMEKVCSLIENDILRLKEICKCRSSVRSNDDTKIKINPEEPEKDIENNITDIKLDIQSKNMSSQVPPNLGMETKSCSCLGDSVNRKKNEKDTHLSSLETQTSHICRCNLSESKAENFEAGKTNDEQKNGSDQLNKPLIQSLEPTSYCYQALCEFQNEKLCQETEGGKKIKQEHDVETAVEKDNSTDIQNLAQPYIGYTVDCSCVYNLGSCICTKSVIQKDKGKIHDIWKSVTKNYINYQNTSYILSNRPKLLNGTCEDSVFPKNTIEKNIESLEITHSGQNIHLVAQKEVTCERKISTGDESDLVLTKSRECHKMHNMTNTNGDSMSLTTDIENEDTIDWYECEHNMSCHHKPEVKYKDCIKFENALYFPLDETFLRKRCNSKTFTDSSAVALKTSISQNCDCNLVPICHVKMLIKNIENKLIYSKCTCDSLSSQVCPVHCVRKFDRCD